MKCMIYGSKYEVILKMLLLYLVDFLKLETYHLVFFLGAGADFFQQLKPDILRDFSESIYFFNHKSHFYKIN